MTASFEGQAMAKRHMVWVVHWTYSEYGGPSFSSQSTYHLTREEAEAYRRRREGDPSERNQRFFEDGYLYYGSEPQMESVGKAEYKRIK
ncbi:MAG TPA: hypothetical protein VNH42_03850, partial [Mariprofundaceae bacterium]|nr:hypothetical protein [Mariprofundaceae bacterium]